MPKVSYSQYSMWANCPQKYKLHYIDGHGKFTSNIHTVFGSSVHDTIQHFLDVMYNVSKKQALTIDLDKLLYKQLIENFTSAKQKEGIEPCTKEELQEFYEQGVAILEWFKKKITKLYSKRGYELVAIEFPINYKIREGLSFIGFIDVLLKDLATQELVIIDLKTSTRGWSKYQKSDRTKTAQLVLYKKFYSEKYDVPLDKIRVEYQIMRRKLWESEYPIPRISKFVPPSGTPTINNTMKEFNNFIDSVFDENNEYKTDKEYECVKAKHCDWCEFRERKICPIWK